MDASIAAAWCFEDQSTRYADAVLQTLIDGAVAVVPLIWKLEVVNALVVAERRKRITPEKSARFIQDLQRFAIEVDADGTDQIFTTVLHQARQFQRSAYDASYLELAKRRGLPFASKDEPLLTAAERLGVVIFKA